MNSRPIYIALGANLPYKTLNPVETLSQAVRALQEEGVELVCISSNWESPAWPDPSDPAYINAVAEVKTDLSARGLLNLLHSIETRFGRVRDVRWASRSLDLDIIDFQGEVLTDDQGLEIPHPRACQRAFVLIPLEEIAPEWMAPIGGDKIGVLIEALNQADVSSMIKLQPTASGASEGLAFDQ